MKRSELFFNFILLPLDALAIFLAFIFAYYLRLSGEPTPAAYIWPFNFYLRFVLVVIPFWLLLFGLEGLYNMKNIRRGFDEFAGIFVSASAGIMFMVAYMFLSHSFFFSRLVILYTWLAAITIITLSRFLVRSLQRYLLKFGKGVHRLALVGDDKTSRYFKQSIRQNALSGYRLVKIIKTPDFEKLEQFFKKRLCDELFVTAASADRLISKYLDLCNLYNVKCHFLAGSEAMQTAKMEVKTILDIPMIECRRTPLEGWGRIIKRVVDVSGSFLGLTILSPFFLLITIAIKISSPGPILFIQERIGEGGEHFRFLKFRTMKTGAEKEHQKMIKKYGNMFKLEEDPRLTAIGGFLRRSSLDELPQLWNVLKGEMSLIGPRPPMPEEVEHYSLFERKRLGIKPGITGLWQVSGRSTVNFNEWVRLDIYYIENWSLWLDFQILLRTFWVVLKGTGAY